MVCCAAVQHFLTCNATLKGNTMSAEKLFTVAGTARNADGTVKARFANDLVARIKILNKAGCTDINLVELPQPMTKLQALQHLQTLGHTQGDAGYAVANKLAEKARVAKRGEVSVPAAAVKTKPAKVAQPNAA
jgi:hypothetical protein